MLPEYYFPACTDTRIKVFNIIKTLLLCLYCLACFDIRPICEQSWAFFGTCAFCNASLANIFLYNTFSEDFNGKTNFIKYE
jgi:hypothetical protein